MTMVREYIPQGEWEYFNSLSIQFRGKHKTANEYSEWVIDREREIVFTNLELAGRDYGETYILIWGKARIYIYAENKFMLHTKENLKKYHWDIKIIKAPISLKNKRNELIDLIREVIDISYDRSRYIDRIPPILVIDNIEEPRFVEENIEINHY